MSNERQRHPTSKNYQQDAQSSYSRSYNKRQNSSLAPQKGRHDENFKKFDSEQIQNIEIFCDGDELKGNYTISQSIASGHLADKGMRSNKNNPHLFYVSHISAAMPYAPILFLEALDQDDETVDRLIGHNIPTSLPRSLRYFHAADLPLGPKTRKAHLLWSIHFATSIKSSFDSNIYQRCAQNAEKFRDMNSVMDPLRVIESNIVLTYKEQTVQWPPIHH